MFVVALLLTLWFYAKLKSADHSVLVLEITENEEIILDGKHTTFEDISSVANHLISELKSQGISSDEIAIAFHADRSLNMGVITEFRNCNLNKIIYER